VLEKGGDEQLDISCEKYYAKSSGTEIICSVNKKTNANCISHILRRNCLLKHVTGAKMEERTEVTGGLIRGRKQLLYVLQKTTEYWKFK
jgi:hypothetical protein